MFSNNSHVWPISEFACVCRDPYLGFDCSIDWTKAPALTGIVGGNLCDTQLNDAGCTQITVTGYPFARGHLMCHLQQLTVGASCWSVYNPQITPATADISVVLLHLGCKWIRNMTRWLHKKEVIHRYTLTFLSKSLTNGQEREKWKTI